MHRFRSRSIETFCAILFSLLSSHGQKTQQRIQGLEGWWPPKTERASEYRLEEAWSKHLPGLLLGQEISSHRVKQPGCGRCLPQHQTP